MDAPAFKIKSIFEKNHQERIRRVKRFVFSEKLHLKTISFLKAYLKPNPLLTHLINSFEKNYETGHRLEDIPEVEELAQTPRNDLPTSFSRSKIEYSFDNCAQLNSPFREQPPNRSFSRVNSLLTISNVGDVKENASNGDELRIAAINQDPESINLYDGGKKITDSPIKIKSRGDDKKFRSSKSPSMLRSENRTTGSLSIDALRKARVLDIVRRRLKSEEKLINFSKQVALPTKKHFDIKKLLSSKLEREVTDTQTQSTQCPANKDNFSKDVINKMLKATLNKNAEAKRSERTKNIQNLIQSISKNQVVSFTKTPMGIAKPIHSLSLLTKPKDSPTKTINSTHSLRTQQAAKQTSLNKLLSLRNKCPTQVTQPSVKKQINLMAHTMINIKRKDEGGLSRSMLHANQSLKGALKLRLNANERVPRKVEPNAGALNRNSALAKTLGNF